MDLVLSECQIRGTDEFVKNFTRGRVTCRRGYRTRKWVIWEAAAGRGCGSVFEKCQMGGSRRKATGNRKQARGETREA